MTEHTTPTGWIAVYRSPEQKQLKQPGHTLPVDGWSPDGDALVVEKHLGARVPAASLPHFVGLEQAPAIVAVLPGQGWRLVVSEEISHPVLGWAIDATGYGVPILTDPDGVAQVEYEVADGQFVPPDHTGSES